MPPRRGRSQTMAAPMPGGLAPTQSAAPALPSAPVVRSPTRLHPISGASPNALATGGRLPAFGANAPAAGFTRPCRTCTKLGEMCPGCLKQGHPLSGAALSDPWSPEPPSPREAERSLARGSPSPMAALRSPEGGPCGLVDGVLAFSPFKAEIVKLHGAVEQLERTLQTGLLNRFVDQSCQLKDDLCDAKLSACARCSQCERCAPRHAAKKDIIMRSQRDCVKLLRQREDKSAQVRKRATSTVLQLVNRFACELASTVNHEMEAERAEELEKKEAETKALRQKLDSSHYDVDSIIESRLRVMKHEAEERAAAEVTATRQREATIRRLEQELSAAHDLNRRLAAKLGEEAAAEAAAAAAEAAKVAAAEAAAQAAAEALIAAEAEAAAVAAEPQVDVSALLGRLG